MAVGIQPSKQVFDTFLTSMARDAIRVLSKISAYAQQIDSYSDDELIALGYAQSEVRNVIRPFVANMKTALAVVTGQLQKSDNLDLTAEAREIAGIVE